MDHTHDPRTPQPDEHVPGESDPGSPPVEPDKGPAPLDFPSDAPPAPVRAKPGEQQTFGELDARIRAWLLPGPRIPPPLRH